MNKIILTLMLLTTGFSAHIKATSNRITIADATELNRILGTNKGKPLSNISITNGTYTVSPMRVGDLMRMGYTRKLTTDEVNILLDQELTSGAKGKLCIGNTLNSRYLSKIDTSDFDFLDHSKLEFTINFSTANGKSYSFTTSKYISSIDRNE